MATSLQFFWDRRQRKLNRSRFNLLLLEHGEYYLEDFSAYHFPLPTNDLSHAFEVRDASKIQGRLKLCSRCILFEPNDVRYALIKFPFRSMVTNSEFQQFRLKKDEQAQLSIQVTGFFTFVCASYMEMKANDKIGPYKVVDYVGDTPAAGDVGHRMLFALVHADLALFLVKIEQLRHVSNMSLKQGIYLANQHLKPFIESALIASFDTSHLVDFHEKFFLPQPMAVRKIKPLIAMPGAMMITSHRIYFQPAQLNNISDSTQSLELKKVVHVYKRRHMLRSIGLEFLVSDGSSILYIFDDTADRDHIYSIIMSLGKISSQHSLPLQEVTRRWQRREMSNFDYLMHLNHEAGRSLNDLTQYPVFPHIIQDYKSKKLNLDNPATFRDLSKPIGALNAERLKFFKDRYNSMPEADLANGVPPPFLYGTHYSTPGYVLFYLVRVAPEYMLCLQNGRFDAPDRMFHSVCDMWESVLTNPADLKELIPEFFLGSGDFLVNAEGLDLGHRHSGERLHDVVLPPWASSPRDYLRTHIKALESDYVSAHLHEWIDLVFGHKQQGPAALAADNVYYYLTYEGSVEVEGIRDSREKAAVEAQIQEFGQCPAQLFREPHPGRNDYSARGGDRGDRAEGGGYVHLGEDFRQAVREAEAAMMPTPPSTSTSTSVSVSARPPRPGTAATAASGGGAKPVGTSGGTSSALKVSAEDTPRVPPPAAGVSASAPPPAVGIGGGGGGAGLAVHRVTLVPTELFYWHSKAITGLALTLSPGEAASTTPSTSPTPAPWLSVEELRLPAAGRRRLTAWLCTVSKDSFLKVVKVDQEPRGDLAASISARTTTASPSPPPPPSSSSAASAAASSLLRTQTQISRSYAPSGSTLSSCGKLSAQRVVVGSYDNNVYGYSVHSATAIGKRYAHYDSVTCVCVHTPSGSAQGPSPSPTAAGPAGSELVCSGSLDGSVKLWPVKAGVHSAHSVLAASPVAEFADYDAPILCVAMDSSGRYLAAGAEDGTLLCWDWAAHALVFSYAASPAKRGLTAVKWLPAESDTWQVAGSSLPKLVCSTHDQRLLCVDARGKLCASVHTASPVLCLDTEGRMVCCGCADGSVRVYTFSQSKITETACYLQAHGGPVTAIALGLHNLPHAQDEAHSSQWTTRPANVAELLATGSEDCSIRLWRLVYPHD